MKRNLGILVLALALVGLGGTALAQQETELEPVLGNPDLDFDGGDANGDEDNAFGYVAVLRQRNTKIWYVKVENARYEQYYGVYNDDVSPYEDLICRKQLASFTTDSTGDGVALFESHEPVKSWVHVCREITDGTESYFTKILSGEFQKSKGRSK